MNEGARQSRCAAVLGLSERTLQRWRGNHGDDADGRSRAVRPVSGNALSAKERTEVLRQCNLPENARKSRPDRWFPKTSRNRTPVTFTSLHPTDPRIFKNLQEISLRLPTTYLTITESLLLAVNIVYLSKCNQLNFLALLQL